MTSKNVKAGPVATGTDLRNSDLAINSDINSLSLQHLQAVKITKRCAVSIALATVLAPFIFNGGAQQ